MEAAIKELQNEIGEKYGLKVNLKKSAIMTDKSLDWPIDANGVMQNKFFEEEDPNDYGDKYLKS